MKILDLLEKTIDNRGKTPPVTDDGYCLLEINCIAGKDKYPDYSLVKKHVTAETYNSWFRSGHPQKGDILIPTVGTLDAVSMMDRDDCCIAQNLVAFRSNPKICDCDFLYYLLCDPTVRTRVLQLDIGAVQPSIKVPHLKNLEVEIPDLDKQKKIARILNILDKKIAINKKINENLEQQAASCFYHQFIVNTSPSWRAGTISDLGTVVGGGTPSKAKAEYYTDNGIAWITPKDLSTDKSKFIAHGTNDITELGLRNSSATIMPAGTVLFSSRAPIGYIAIADGEVSTNQGFKSIIPFNNVGTAFVYFFLKNALPTIENMASGSTFKEISGSAMRTVPALIPDNDSLHEFSIFCEPLFKQQRMLEAENRSLAALRDALLPHLMSGELDVSNLNI